MRIARESWFILFLGLADLITTIVFIRAHGAEEANPLFRRYWEMSPAAFVAAKLVLLAGPLAILEWARRRNPRFVMLSLRAAIVGYVIMYGVGYYRLNGPAARAESTSAAEMHSPYDYSFVDPKSGDPGRPIHAGYWLYHRHFGFHPAVHSAIAHSRTTPVTVLDIDKQ